MSVYLDYAATAPLRSEVLETYTHALQTLGNPSSIHSFGQRSRGQLEQARESIATSLGCDRHEVIFTSGGTESNNLAIKGLFLARRAADPARRVIVSSYAEHHAVIDPIEWLEKHESAEVVWLPVHENGQVDLDALARLLAERGNEIALVSLMWANNEVGVITDVRRVVELAASHGIPVHTDAVAAVGHIPVDFASSGVETLAISGHKLGAPIGTGALLVKRSSKLVSQLQGGGQERELRAGTVNFAGAIALARAVEIAVAEQPLRASRLAPLQQRLIEGIKQIASDARFSGEGSPRLADNVHFTFPGCAGDSMLYLLDEAGIAISNGSACQAGVARSSHVLIAMGRSEADASGCIRITMGLETSEQDIQAFLDAFPAVHQKAKLAGLN